MRSAIPNACPTPFLRRLRTRRVPPGDAENERAYRAMVDVARATGGTTTRPSGRCSLPDSFPAAALSRSSGSTSCAARPPPRRSRRGYWRRARHGRLRLLAEIRTPTLVIHARDDGVVPIAEGRLMAAGSPARSSSSSILATTSCSRPSRRGSASRKRWWIRGQARRTGDTVFAALSPREREMLTLIAKASATPRCRAGAAAKRPSAITPRASSTSSACGLARRRWSSRATTATTVDRTCISPQQRQRWRSTCTRSPQR